MSPMQFSVTVFSGEHIKAHSGMKLQLSDTFFVNQDEVVSLIKEFV